MSIDSLFTVFVLMAFFVLIIIISYIYSNCISKNDFYSIGSLIATSIQIIDTVSDVLFIINITYQSNYPSIPLLSLLISSIVFIVFPVIITLFQLSHQMKKWQRIDDIGAWTTDNVTMLYIISVITGSSFAAVQLCTSNLFNMSQFDMPLSKIQIEKYRTKRVYSIVLLEVCSCSFLYRILQKGHKSHVISSILRKLHISLH